MQSNPTQGGFKDWLVRAELNFSLNLTRSFHPWVLRQMLTGELVY